VDQLLFGVSIGLVRSRNLGLPQGVMHFLGGKLLFGEAISARIVLPNNAQVKAQLTYQLAYK
jgi:hypothetical protein